MIRSAFDQTFGARCMRFWLPALMAVLAMVASLPVRAACSFASGYGLQNVLISLPASMAVPREAAVGTVIATAKAPATPETATFATCTSPGNAYRYMSASSPVSAGSPPIFPTSVPGIGLAAYFQDGATLDPFVANGAGSADSHVGNWAWSTDGNAYWVAELVVTGPVSAGTDSGSLSATVTLDSLEVASISFSAFSVTTLGCSTPDVVASLGQHALSEFQGINTAMSTSPLAVSIAVNACPAGMSSIGYEFEATTAVLNAAGGVVALDASSTATGVGIFVTDGSGSAIQFGTPYTLSSYSSSTGGSYTIPLQVGYYQTAASITPGSANTSLMFTMTYQ